MSIPIFTAQLEKSREATDLANLRAFKATAVSEYLVGDTSDTNVTWTDANDASKGFTAYYDAASGKMVVAKPSNGYGAGTATVGSANNTEFGYVPGESVADKVIKVVVNDQGECTFTWEAHA